MNRQSSPKNLLIVRTDRIGDVILSLPLARLVKEKYPDCIVTFLLRSYTKQLAENHPYIDEVLILNESGDKIPVLQNVRQIKEKHFDACIMVYPTFITSLIIFLSGISLRIGTGYRWYSSLFNRKVYVHRKYGEKHELEFNVDLLKEIEIERDVTPSNVNFNINISRESINDVKKILKENNILPGKPVIIVHPGSGGSAVDFPIPKMKELVTLISDNLDCNIILTGSEKEKELCESLKISSKVKNLAGFFDLSHLIAIIGECDIFIANSTGPIHIAAALNKYTIGFYPNILACSARRWGPYSAKSTVFTPAKDCMDCRREQCEVSDCMNTIKVTDVFARIENIYKLIGNNGEI